MNINRETRILTEIIEILIKWESENYESQKFLWNKLILTSNIFNQNDKSDHASIRRTFQTRLKNSKNIKSKIPYYESNGSQKPWKFYFVNDWWKNIEDNNDYFLKGSQIINEYIKKNERNGVKHTNKFYEIEELTINEEEIILFKSSKESIKKIRDATFIKKAKEKYFSETEGRCQGCKRTQDELWGFKNEKFLEVHHIEPFREKILSTSFKNLDSILEKFKFLCPNCHYLEDKKLKKNN